MQKAKPQWECQYEAGSLSETICWLNLAKRNFPSACLKLPTDNRIFTDRWTRTVARFLRTFSKQFRVYNHVGSLFTGVHPAVWDSGWVQGIFSSTKLKDASSVGQGSCPRSGTLSKFRANNELQGIFALAARMLRVGRKKNCFGGQYVWVMIWHSLDPRVPAAQTPPNSFEKLPPSKSSNYNW